MSRRTDEWADAIVAQARQGLAALARRVVLERGLDAFENLTPAQVARAREAFLTHVHHSLLDSRTAPVDREVLGAVLMQLAAEGLVHLAHARARRG